MHMQFPPTSVHNFVFSALFSCTFPAAAAVRVQSAICCGCDLANCLQEKQKAKTIQLSPNNPTTATMTTTIATTTKARNRLWPGAIYIARHFASSPCLHWWGYCVWLRFWFWLLQRLLQAAATRRTLFYPLSSNLVCRSKVERSSNCLPGVFTAASGFFPQLFDLWLSWTSK